PRRRRPRAEGARRRGSAPLVPEVWTMTTASGACVPPLAGGSLLTEIDHVAIAVNDLETAVAWYAEVFGATVVHRETVERDGVEEALLAVADSFVQLLTPVRDDSPVAKYLAAKGEGIHHVGYRVADCAAALKAVRD